MYAITTGVPVEPEDMWNSRRSSFGTVLILSGYASRKSSFVRNGSFCRSSSDLTSCGSSNPLFLRSSRLHSFDHARSSENLRPLN